MEITDLQLGDRQKWTDAAVAELRLQLGADAIRQIGTSVEVKGAFKVPRVLEAMIRAAFADNGHIFDALVDTIAAAARVDRGRAPEEKDFERFHEIADQASNAVRNAILWQLDPLP